LPKQWQTNLKAGKATTKRYKNYHVHRFQTLRHWPQFPNKHERTNEIFSQFDDILEVFGIEKIKTIGDAYFAACGVPVKNKDHAFKCIEAVKQMFRYLEERNKENEIQWKMRVGIHSGPVVAGVVSKKKYAYDLFGDTVNTASRMESNGEVGKINISETTYELIKGKYNCFPRGQINAKGKGNLNMYFVE
jgi:class 3 adenylate cyclase